MKTTANALVVAAVLAVLAPFARAQGVPRQWGWNHNTSNVFAALQKARLLRDYVEAKGRAQTIHSQWRNYYARACRAWRRLSSTQQAYVRRRLHQYQRQHQIWQTYTRTCWRQVTQSGWGYVAAGSSHGQSGGGHESGGGGNSVILLEKEAR